MAIQAKLIDARAGIAGACARALVLIAQAAMPAQMAAASAPGNILFDATQSRSWLEALCIIGMFSALSSP
jgi:hypothetical protein